MAAFTEAEEAFIEAARKVVLAGRELDAAEAAFAEAEDETIPLGDAVADGLEAREAIEVIHRCSHEAADRAGLSKDETAVLHAQLDQAYASVMEFADTLDKAVLSQANSGGLEF